MDEETIVSLATPLGRAGVAVVRVSGKKTRDILDSITNKKKNEFKHRLATYCLFKLNSKIIDDGLVTFFQGPNSFTGEDVAELSIHSNPVIIDELISYIIDLGARQSLAGEFTYRAFKNGKIDLIQAESINDLINSNSKLSTQMSFNNLEGKLSKLLNSVKKLLTKLGIIIESSIEFGEEHYLEDKPIIDELENTLRYIEQILSASRFNNILDNGFKIVIAGKVNVGKSSIFNELVLEDRSIVSDIPGTTRDFIEKKIFLNGFAFEIIDIAGFNDKSSDVIEDEGMKRSLEKLNNCDAVIFVLDSSANTDKNDMAIYELIKDKKHIIIANKKDISDDNKLNTIKDNFIGENINWISVKKNDNTDIVINFLKSLTDEMEDSSSDIIVNQRQKKILIELVRLMKIILIEQKDETNTELIAEDIRGALNLIGEITGKVAPEDILNGIFSTFCVGK